MSKQLRLVTDNTCKLLPLIVEFSTAISFVPIVRGASGFLLVAVMVSLLSPNQTHLSFGLGISKEEAIAQGDLRKRPSYLDDTRRSIF